MSTTHIKIAAGAGLLLVIFFLGFWLSRAGKPYNLVVFTIHKLAALGGVIALAVTVVKAQQAAPLGTALLVVIGLGAVCALAAFVSGALLSLDKAMPPVVLGVHQVAPYLILVLTAASLYLLLDQGAVALP